MLRKIEKVTTKIFCNFGKNQKNLRKNFKKFYKNLGNFEKITENYDKKVNFEEIQNF